MLSYTDGMTVNGEKAKSDSFGYATLNKVWKSGETIEIVIPKNMTVTELNGKISVSSGIIVLAVDERIEDIDVKVTDKITHVEKITTPFPTREVYNVTFSNGTTVKMVDFASAGWDFSHEKGRITVWMDKDN